jgi:hypothetical protein
VTEINIERKSGRSIWPWLVGLAVLALLFALLRNRGGDDVTAGDTRADSAITNTSTGAVATDTAGGRRP